MTVTTERQTSDSWREHFSDNAGDLLQIQRVFAGEQVFRVLLRACMVRWAKSRNKAGKMNERTVLNVLSDPDIWEAQ